MSNAIAGSIIKQDVIAYLGIALLLQSVFLWSSTRQARSACFMMCLLAISKLFSAYMFKSTDTPDISIWEVEAPHLWYKNPTFVVCTAPLWWSRVFFHCCLFLWWSIIVVSCGRVTDIGCCFFNCVLWWFAYLYSIRYFFINRKNQWAWCHENPLLTHLAFVVLQVKLRLQTYYQNIESLLSTYEDIIVKVGTISFNWKLSAPSVLSRLMCISARCFFIDLVHVMKSPAWINLTSSVLAGFFFFFFGSDTCME